MLDRYCGAFSTTWSRVGIAIISFTVVAAAVREKLERSFGPNAFIPPSPSHSGPFFTSDSRKLSGGSLVMAFSPAKKDILGMRELSPDSRPSRNSETRERDGEVTTVEVGRD